MGDRYLYGLIDSNLSVLQSAVRVLSQLTAEQFTKVKRPYFEASLGKHLRHIMDHYLCFRRDLDSGLIDYDQRNRDCRLETDKEYALNVVTEMYDFLSSAKQCMNSSQKVQVLMCNDINLPNGSMSDSTLGRELQFLHSHSVHHFALMATIMKVSGFRVEAGFGVAPSTLIHEKTVQESA